MEDDDLEKKVLCIHQLVRPEFRITPPSGWGYCKVCEYDPERNKTCAGYVPVRIHEYKIIPVTYEELKRKGSG